MIKSGYGSKRDLFPYFDNHRIYGVSKDEIGEMLGHSNSIVTEHYLAGLEKEKKKKINSVLPQRQQNENFAQGFPQGIVESLGKYGLK